MTSKHLGREFTLAIILDTNPHTISDASLETSLETIEDQEIRGQSLMIDDKRFVRCTLVDCILEYSGRPVVFDRTHLQRCRYVFFGRARSTVHFLQGVGLMEHSPGDWGEFPERVH